MEEPQREIKRPREGAVQRQLAVRDQVLRAPHPHEEDEQHVESNAPEPAAALGPAMRATLKTNKQEKKQYANGRVASSIQRAQEKSATPHVAPEPDGPGAAYQTPETTHRNPRDVLPKE